MNLINDNLVSLFDEYPLGSQDGLGGEAVVLCKFFNPVGAGTWYVLEAEKQPNGDYLFYGYVELLDDEYGYFSLSELEGLEIPLRLGGVVVDTVGIERDLYFGSVKMSKVLN